MLLPLYHHHNPVFRPTNHFPPFLITNQTLTLQNPAKTSKSLIQCSTTQNPLTHTKNLPKSTIERIAYKLRSLGIIEQTTKDQTLNLELETMDIDSAGEIFIPLPNKLPKCRVGHTIDTSWSTPENPLPNPCSGSEIVRYNKLRSEVQKQKLLEKNSNDKVVPSLAELKLSAEELKRLRTIGIGLRKKLKVGRAGITEGIVNGIHERWRNSEVVKIVCEDLCRLNMKRTHDLLERKTGGLVVWRSGSKIILYRGADYKYPYFICDKSSTYDASLDALCDPHVDSRGHDEIKRCSSGLDGVKTSGPSPTNQRVQPTLIHGVGSPDKIRFQLPGEAQLVEEANRLLDGLGPRFTDWWGYDPQPVDADLLPAMIPGYRRPFRLLPYGVQPKLTNDEMTTLRRLGRHLPCHFALGKNRKHQGLAVAIVKLWEKCEIAKIAIKRGVQNTNSELMAEELKWLTGGCLLSRDREFITIYRGKDFLPTAVSSAIEERRKHGILFEKRRIEFSKSSKAAQELKHANAGDMTLSDSEDESGSTNDHKSIQCSEQKKLWSADAAVRRTSIKLSVALDKKAKAEKLLAELEKTEISQQPELDKEGITEEERYMLRKVGLRMKAFLLLGRRGVFDGTVENMHLHWKYRELVKIISKEKSIEAACQEARTLEAESGGILVAVERVSKGYAIIVYRGKNYERPACLRPKTLLTKREAMKRSLEMQRRESLNLHVLELAQNIDKLKLQLAREEHKADSTSVLMDDTIKGLPATDQDKLFDFSSAYNGIEISKTGFESSSDSISKEIQQEGMGYSAVVNAEHCSSNNEPIESSLESTKNKPQPSVLIKNENKQNDMASTPVHLSNRNRLLLRKQALKSKKRPMLVVVGRSNMFNGVAKTIKAHFRKHPLVIVNVKGRAKGTSVQEVILKLQEATGAVLVSQEPSKVILYRGWGAEDEPASRDKNAKERASVGREVEPLPAVSPELLAAIRLECGLQDQEELDATTM